MHSNDRLDRWRLVAFFGGALVIVLADQATKALVRDRLALGQQWPTGWDLIHLTHYENSGAAFGILQGASVFLVLSSLIAIGAVMAFIFWAPRGRWYTLAFTLLLGGALGNLIDRVTRVTVTDFIKPTHYPAFNVADSSIVIGVTLLILLSFIEEPRARPTGDADRGDAAAGSAGDDADTADGADATDAGRREARA